MNGIRRLLLSVVLASSAVHSAQGKPVESAPPPPVRVGAVVTPELVPVYSVESTAEMLAPEDTLYPETANEPLAFGDGVSIWTEGAENGYGDLIDGTDAGYDLIQSERVAKGNYAFHLANPNFNDNWFALDVAIDVQTDTKLFFLSRLQWATSTQVAKVQISLDGGSTWPDTAYSQAGAEGGIAGEGTFSLREIDLGTVYSGQQVRIRFYYDFTTGSGYTQTTTDVGWLIDDIQIGSEFEKTLWEIGDPTATEVLYLEYLNRARADAMVEAVRLAALTDPDVTSAYSYFGIDPADIITQFNWYVGGCMDQYAQPLAFQAQLMEAAQKHSQDMFNNQFQGHNSSSNPVAPFQPGDSLGMRLDRVGYTGGAGENVYAYADSVEHGHAGFDVDWGNVTNTESGCYNPGFAGQGMQNPSGHRINMHTAAFNEAGMGVVNGTNGSVGPQIITQDLGSASGVAYITGVIYDDSDADAFYSATDDTTHEGRSGIHVAVDGSPYYAVSTASGAYAIPVTTDGSYTVTFSGAGIETYQTTVNISGGLNVKLDHDPVDASRYQQWADAHGVTGLADEDDDKDGVANIIESGIVGMVPTEADSYRLPAFVPGGDGKMRFTVEKQTDATDLQFEVLLSADLSSWHAPGVLAGTAIETETESELTVVVDAGVTNLFAKLLVSFIE